MNSTLRKDIKRLIVSSKGRFFSLTAIVLIGVSFFVGISSVSTIMGYSVDTYDDALNLKDITVYSNYGFDAADIDAIKTLKDIDTVEGAHFVDVLAISEETTFVTRVHSYDPSLTINHFRLVEGRLPENKNEVLAEHGTDMMSGFAIGSKIKLSRPDNDLNDYLSVEEVTVVGTIDTPLYLNETKENSTLSNQVLRTYLYIPVDAFTEDYYTEVNILVSNAKKMNSFSKEYLDYTEQVKKEIENLGNSQAAKRKDSVLEDALQKYQDGLNEYNDGKKEFDEKIADAEKEIGENEEKIQNGEIEIQDGFSALNSAQEEIDAKEIEGANQIHAARDEISKGEETLSEKKADFEKTKEDLNSKLKEIESGKEQISQVLELLNGYLTLQSNLENINKSIDSLNTEQIQNLLLALEAYPEETAILSIPQDSLKMGVMNLIDSLNQIYQSISNANEERNIETTGEFLAFYNEVKAALNFSKTSLENAKTALEPQLTQIGIQDTNSGEEINLFITQYTNQFDQLNIASKKIEDGITSGEKQIQDAEAELKKAYDMTVNASVELDEKIVDARKEIDENRQKLFENQKDLEEAKEKIIEAKEELEKGRIDGEQELIDAKAKLDKAWQDIQDLDDASWTVLNRSQHYSSETYRETIKQMQAIANIFPVFFLLVAALVCLTTMTRMVDEQRGQIGIMRALGYSEFQCATKYLVYAGLATFIGEILGSIFGMLIFPPIIYTLWRMMYILPEFRIKIPWNLVLFSSILFLIVMELTTWNACHKDTKEVPSQLLRPKAPHLGKSTFIEKIGFIWNKLSFTWKITVRNLIRYKKRFFMTVFGVAGCTALLITGWGVRDSVKAMVDIQFSDIIYFDGIVTADDTVSVSQFQLLYKDIKEREDVKNAISILDYTSKMAKDSIEENVYTYAFEKKEDIENFIQLRTRTKHTPVELTDDGIVISEKLAENMHLHVGSTVILESKEGVKKEVKVSGICEMYIQHYVFMTQDYYNTIFNTSSQSNAVCVEINGDDDISLLFQKDIVNHDYVNSISFNESVLNNFRTMANSLDLVVWVLLIASMSLAFVVLGNLTNVNISERQREIATLKVLGFRKKEVENYIYKENNVLTFIGSILGIPVGILLHHYIMRQVEMDYIMFGRSVKPISFVYSILLTIAFGFLVNYFMRKKLKRIDMIESLKSVE